MMINKILLSPPFSNIYPNIKGTTRIVGTYTLNKRPGLHRVLTTLRKTEDGWLNNVGLRNPGIKNFSKKNVIISISILEESELSSMFYYLYYKSLEYNILGVELNISCPNKKVINIENNFIQDINKKIAPTIIKIPHNTKNSDLDLFINSSCHYIHVSNTKKTEKGALSGKSLIDKNITNIKYIKENSYKKIIAGGGIYSFEDLINYKNAGADFFSLSTILLNPIKTYKIINQWSQYQKQD
jgi:dihydroorotate dehydrogenase